MYYKVVYDKNVIDVLDNLTYILYQPLHNIYLICDSEDSACGIQSSTQETFYHIDGMTEFPVTDFKTVKLIEIDEEEYETLKEALGLNEEIIYEPDEPVEEEEVEVEPTDEEILYNNTLEMVRAQKIKKMSEICGQVITNGVDVELSDGNTYHFSLTIQDQLNLMTLADTIVSGEELIPYHADGELCKYYEAQDILTIVQTAKNFELFQVTYFNALRAYIEALDSIEDIGAVEYGMEIPDEYQSDVLKDLLGANESQDED